MLAFAAKEQICELSFQTEGPFWHLYTDGTRMQDIFCCEDEFKKGMTALAVCVILSPDVELVTFELMNNHIHLILCGSKTGGMELFSRFRRRLKRLSRQWGRILDWDAFEPQILEIESLQALRNEIIYVNRNAYVASYQYTPFSYPWGGGWAYFLPVIGQLQVMSLQDIGARMMRELTHYRNVEEISALKFVGDVPFIPSFCRVDIGERLFQNARSYFHLLTRNVEAFSQVASRLKDMVFLTDDEMFVVATRIASEIFSAKLAMLTSEQKIQLARKLHFDYNASNQQLRRILKLDLTLINELFPKVPPSKHQGCGD